MIIEFDLCGCGILGITGVSSVLNDGEVENFSNRIISKYKFVLLYLNEDGNFCFVKSCSNDEMKKMQDKFSRVNFL